MWLWQKSETKASSRQQIRIKEVIDGILILPNDEYRLLIESSSINLELKSDEEQDVLLDNFQTFLNSLPCPLQILIRVKEVDIDRYVEQIVQSKAAEPEAVYQAQIENYAEFIQDLVKGNKILSRRFYLIIPYHHIHKTKDFAYIKEQMNLRRDVVIRGLEKLGMKAAPLHSLQVMELFYSFYNPGQLKTQPLTAQTLKLLFEEPVHAAN